MALVRLCVRIVTVLAVVLTGNQAGAATVGLCRSEPSLAPASPLGAPGVTGSAHTLAIVYVLPTDIAYDAQVHARLKQASANIQAWYQCASGGLTWEFGNSDTVGVYYAQYDRLYYVNNGNWWGSLLAEMASAGQPAWSPGTVLAIWAHGAGWWAGAAQSCSGECGVALLGVELFPEFNDPDYSGGTCPGGSGLGAWPCTPDGAFAHELGHTLGLPHPADVPSTSAVAGHSIMQTHWNYPHLASGGEAPWGFLSLERQVLLTNPFMKWNLPLSQVYPGCDVVNLPDLGSAPTAMYDTTGSYLNKFVGTNLSAGALHSYWMFGDSGVSNATSPTHYYMSIGTRVVTLRSMAANGMVDTAAAAIVVTGAPAETASLPMVYRATPNPFERSTTIAFSHAGVGAVQLTVYDVAGRRVRTLVSRAPSSGARYVDWDGRDDRGVDVSAGVYLVRLDAGGSTQSKKIVRLR